MEKSNTKKVIKIGLLTIFGLIAICCDSNYKQIGDSYYLRTGDLQFMVDIGYGYTDSEGSEGFIDQTVFEVFWDNNYIIAKRYPNLDKKIIEYYIAKKVKDDIKLAVKNRFGPYNLKQFDTKLKEFKLDTNEMEHKLFDYLK